MNRTRDNPLKNQLLFSPLFRSFGRFGQDVISYNFYFFKTSVNDIMRFVRKERAGQKKRKRIIFNTKISLQAASSRPITKARCRGKEPFRLNTVEFCQHYIFCQNCVVFFLRDAWIISVGRSTFFFGPSIFPST